MRVVDTHHHTWIANECAAFGGVLAGVERQLAVVHDKPDRRHQRSTVGREVTQHPGAGPFGQESDHVIGELVHPLHGRRGHLAVDRQSSAWRSWSHRSRRTCRLYRPTAASGALIEMQTTNSAFTEVLDSCGATVGDRLERGLSHGVIPVAVVGDPALDPSVEQVAGTKQRKQVGYQLRVDTVVEQLLDEVSGAVPVDRDIG